MLYTFNLYQQNWNHYLHFPSELEWGVGVFFPLHLHRLNVSLPPPCAGNTDRLSRHHCADFQTASFLRGSKLRVQFLLFTSSSPSCGELISADDGIKNCSFNSSLETKIIIHGFRWEEEEHCDYVFSGKLNRRVAACKTTAKNRLGFSSPNWTQEFSGRSLMKNADDTPHYSTAWSPSVCDQLPFLVRASHHLEPKKS